MIKTLAVENYRSIRNLVLPLSNLNVITGANGSGKSNLFKALRLLAEIYDGGVTKAVAMEGGLSSIFWAGAEASAVARNQRAANLGTANNGKKRLRLGFSGGEFGYAISLGLPPPPPPATSFSLDPEIKRECVWAGETCRPSSLLIDRKSSHITLNSNREQTAVAGKVPYYESMLSYMGYDHRCPELGVLKDMVGRWRFYDSFRTDLGAPARRAQIGTRTLALHNDGRDLAAALQTIREIGDSDALDRTIDEAFPGASVEVATEDSGVFTILFNQRGLLRPLRATELSDGTLRFLLLTAALLTPRPPSMMVLNEPEASLHPELLPALADLIKLAATRCQMWVITHSIVLSRELERCDQMQLIVLEKEDGRTGIPGRGILDVPLWKWPD
ncbi:AAA family ATPase [Pseudomonas graminis]|uniref:ATP-binding protein n=1 Tax=Pseudomonas graminis TaxID=158627 RepID=A0A1C2EF12_9PSED|nr:AAA family ATPase [Pseudomonas graminis]OCX25550.1 ATP-binding protein [Pseudomonas graminis]